MLGLVLVAIMTLGFVGAFESYGINKGTSALFWGCAGGALMIIIYRKMKRKQVEKESQKYFRICYEVIKHRWIDRSIKENSTQCMKGSMTGQTKQWWEGLGDELETDIETFDQ